MRQAHAIARINIGNANPVVGLLQDRAMSSRLPEAGRPSQEPLSLGGEGWPSRRSGKAILLARSLC